MRWCKHAPPTHGCFRSKRNRRFPRRHMGRLPPSQVCSSRLGVCRTSTGVDPGRAWFGLVAFARETIYEPHRSCALLHNLGSASDGTPPAPSLGAGVHGCVSRVEESPRHDGLVRALHAIALARVCDVLQDDSDALLTPSAALRCKDAFVVQSASYLAGRVAVPRTLKD